MPEIKNNQELTDVQKKLIEKLKGRDTVGGDGPMSKNKSMNQNQSLLRRVVKVPSTGRYPLSSAQKRLFVLEQMLERSTAYNLPIALEVKGLLSLSVLQKAVEELIKRHDSLRTCFKEIEGQMVQQVNDQLFFQIEYVQSTSENLETLLLDFIRPFDLSKVPLFRMKVVKVLDERYFLFLDIHHIIADGASLALLLEELAFLYEQKPLPIPAIQYKDYTFWQMELLSSLSIKTQKQYWLQQFSEEIPILQLPYDYSRPKIPDYKGATFNFVFNVDLTASLKNLAVKENVTLYTLLMTLYQTLLFKYTNQKEIIIGSSVRGRPVEDLKRVIGVFVNAIPIRTRPFYSTSFREFLQETKNKCIEGLQNQDYPFEDLIEALGVQREIGRNPIFETFFDLHQDRHMMYHFGGLELQRLPMKTETAKFDLSLEITDQGDTMECYFEYATSLFKSEKIARMAKHLIQIAQEIIQNPKIVLGNINMLDLAEKERLFAHLNVSPWNVPPSTPLFLDVFKEQVVKNQDRVAAVYENETLTYGELERQSTHLAYHLLHLGIKEDERIAFYMDRSILFLISMLAVFKTGASYVPLDPNVPKERVDALIEESQCRFLLTDFPYDKKACPVYDVLMLLQSPISPFPFPEIDPLHIAYTIFTSGSTGKPKGAMVEHKGMVNHLWAKIRSLNLTEEDILAQTSSQTFDVSVWQFIVMLMIGGKVVIFSNEKSWDPYLLLHALEQEKITVFQTVPSHMNLVMEELTKKTRHYQLEGMKWLILNGEPLLEPLCQWWRQYYPQVSILNAYGPTECSDDVTHHEVENNIKETGIAIGKILPNLKMYVLDQNLSPVPFGNPGDAYVEGVGLCRGYLNAPDKTAAAFLPFAFPANGTQGKRMYRTGDIVRYRADQNLECLGRSDYQIKIRGQRVELGEIEAVLNRHEDVLQCVVEFKQVNKKEKELVAYLVLKAGEWSISFSEKEKMVQIRGYIENKLSQYMVPSYFQVLPALPLLSNGKVNRKALPKPEERLFSETEVDFVPKTDVEKKLVGIWKELLSISHLNVHDNFFQLGGHSLLGTQLISRILRTFNVKLPLRFIFEFPTIAGLSKLIGQELKSKQTQIHEVLPEVTPDLPNRYEEFPLTDVQQAYWLGRSGMFNLGEVSVHIYSEYETDRIDLDKLEKSWNKMITRHEALRIILTQEGNQRILQSTPAYHIDILDLSQENAECIEKELSKRRELYSHEVFPSDTWPLFSIRAVKFQDKIRLSLSFDSLILDGWSVDLLFKEWARSYENIEAEYPALELSFRDYVLTAKEIKKSEIYQKDREYWLKRAEDFPRAPSLPLVKSDQDLQRQTFSRYSKTVNADNWKSLKTQAQIRGLSPTGFLLATLAEVLYFYSGNNRFVINLTLFDRLPIHRQINDIAGDFTSLTLLEVDRRSIGSTFASRAQKLQEQLWSDLDHHLFGGIEFIRELSQKRASLKMDAQFPVVFTSILGLEDNQHDDMSKLFGKEVFSISQTPQVWLDCKVYEINGELILEWDFVKELFAEGLVEGMHECYFHLVHLFLKNIENWDSLSFDLLSEREKQQRSLFNHTAGSSKKGLIQDLFNQKALLNPQCQAMVDAKKTWTYEDLSNQSNQLAHYLRTRPIKRTELVAIIMEKGGDQVVGCLAILKAGAPFLPLDPHLPTARLEEMLSIGGPKILLTQERFAEKLNSVDYVRRLSNDGLLVIDTDPSIFASYPITIPDPCQTPSDLAYVIFTSGSTGKPKGVMIQHEAVFNTLLDINERFQVTKEDKVLALSQLTFDLSIYDIFGVLGAGGTVIFPDPEKIKNPHHWLELIHEHRITLWNTVPMFMQMLVEAIQLKQLPAPVSLRLILLSGDWIPIELPEKIYNCFKEPLRLISLGGATEASIWSIFYEISSHEIFVKSIPYGAPLKNQTFFVFNDQLQICPEGVAGELYIGGIGLSMGYWKDKEKTDAVYLIHPEYGRIYKTGDLGRYLPQNIIEFLGRVDFQVKISGFRIELQEIEQALLNHEEVDSAIVCAQNNQLAAYVIPKGMDDAKFESFSISTEEALAFKLDQNGIRKLPQCRATPLAWILPEESKVSTYFHRKSYRDFAYQIQNKEVLFKTIRDLFEAQQSPTSLEHSVCDLHRLLQPFAAYPSSSQLLPKYRYPSAGNLYPVQLYLTIGKEALPGIEPGNYYYNPLQHELKLISQDVQDSIHPKQAALYFVGQLDAIKPLYGTHAEDFCFLEAGYMLHLLHTVCQEIGIAVSPMPHPEKLDESFALNKNHLLLKGILLNGKENETTYSPECLLFLKESAFGHSLAGWYQLNKTAFKLIAHVPHFHLLPQIQDTYSIYHSASFAIFFFHPFSHSLSNEKEYLLSIGRMGQALMEKGSELGLGFCPIGALDHRALGQLSQINGEKKWLHALFGGGISEEQIYSTHASHEKKGVYEDVLRTYLESRLPNYMVPSHFMMMDRFPLSSNGKVDRLALPPIKMLYAPKGIRPQTEKELQIAQIWAEVLQLPIGKVSINETFYELGGNSLMIIQVHHQLTKNLGLVVSIETLFQYPTIGALAKFLGNEKHFDLDKENIHLQANKQKMSRLNKRERAQKNG